MTRTLTSKPVCSLAWPYAPSRAVAIASPIAVAVGGGLRISVYLDAIPQAGATIIGAHGDKFLGLLDGGDKLLEEMGVVPMLPRPAPWTGAAGLLRPTRGVGSAA